MLAVVMFVAALTAVSGIGGAQAAAPNPTFSISPSTVNINSASAVTFKIRADPNATPLAAFALFLDYDPSKVTLTCGAGAPVAPGAESCGALDANTLFIAYVHNVGGGATLPDGDHEIRTISATRVGTPAGNTPLTLSVATLPVTGLPGTQGPACLNLSNTPLNNCEADDGTISFGGAGNCAQPNFNLPAGFSGQLWCGSTVTGGNNIATTLPLAVQQVYQFDNTLGAHAVWFRTSATTGLGNLTSLSPGSFHIYNTNGATTVNVPNPGTFSVPAPGGNFNTASGFKSQLWSGNFVPLANMATTLPTQVTQVYAFDNTLGVYTVWFRTGATTGSGNLSSGGLTSARTYIFVANGVVNVVMN
jgi:hypothetical protein